MIAFVFVVYRPEELFQILGLFNIDPYFSKFWDHNESRSM